MRLRRASEIAAVWYGGDGWEEEGVSNIAENLIYVSYQENVFTLCIILCSPLTSVMQNACNYTVIKPDW